MNADTSEKGLESLICEALTGVNQLGGAAGVMMEPLTVSVDTKASHIRSKESRQCIRTQRLTQ